MVVYFSGTGNSRYAAEYIAAHTGNALVSIKPFLEGKKAELESQAPWVFVSPTYAWRIPRIFEHFLETERFSGSTDVYFVMTCGDEIGNAEHYLRALCAKKGWRFRGVTPVIMPENYTAMFAVPDAESASRIIAQAEPALCAAVRAIRENRDFAPVGRAMLDKLKSGPVNTLFYSLCVNARAFRVSEECVGCGKCAAACPTGALRMAHGRPSWGSGCTHCMACINGCPVAAIEYGKKSRGKPRYQCPHYTLTGAEETEKKE